MQKVKVNFLRFLCIILGNNVVIYLVYVFMENSMLYRYCVIKLSIYGILLIIM